MATSPDAALQRQLLALLQTKGNAATTFRLLIESSISECALRSQDQALALLQKASQCSYLNSAAASKASATKKPPPKRSKESEKQWALIAAKIVQSVVKLYIGGASQSSGSTAKNDDTDLVTALYLAVAGLRIAFEHESLIRLGELVLENMLYQVAKKLSEIPKCTGSSMWLFAALHARLWHHHNALCTQLKEKGQDGHRAAFDKLLKTPSPSLQIDHLAWVCSVPPPNELHTGQYTRLLISVANTEVTMLLAQERNDDILTVAAQLEPWIAHLARIPGVDAKLPVSFSDRLFRVLWKCATAVDAAEASKGQRQDVDRSLAFRSLALVFLLKCPTYTNTYFIQQVHRVGAQFEKKHASRPAVASTSIRCFYLQSIAALYANHSSSTPAFEESKTLSWDYIHWLEHYVSISDGVTGAGQHEVDALTAMYSAMQHADTYPPTGVVISGCWKLLSAAMVLDRRPSISQSKSSLTERDIRKALETNAFPSTLSVADRDAIVTLLSRESPSKASTSDRSRWLVSVDSILDSTSAAIRVVRDSGKLELTDSACNFIVRMIRRLTVRLFNKINGNDPPITDIVDAIHKCMQVSADVLAAIREMSTSITAQDSILAAEGRTRRLLVACCARQATADQDQASTWLDRLNRNLRLFHGIVNTALLAKVSPGPSRDQLAIDIQAIARDTYACASHFYKLKHFDLAVLSLDSTLSTIEAFLNHLVSSPQSPDQVATAHSKLKVEAIAGLLGFSLRQIGASTRSRECQGLGILYASIADPSAVFESRSIDKYATMIVDEANDASSDGGGLSALVKTVVTLCERLSVAWKARGVAAESIKEVHRMMCGGFGRESSRLLEELRQAAEQKQPDPGLVDRLPKSIEAAIAVEQALWKTMRTSHYSTNKLVDSMLIVEALGQRTRMFGQYYRHHDSVKAVAGLVEARVTLANAIDGGTLSTVDVGGCSGWRGVLTLEICQLKGPETKEGSVSTSVNEATALADIKKCLATWEEFAWNEVPDSMDYFDYREATECLDAVTKALSLLSHVELEQQARRLLDRIGAATNAKQSRVPTSLPSFILHPGHAPPFVEQDTTAPAISEPAADSAVLNLQVIDAELGLCATALSTDDAVQARQHLEETMALIKSFRSSTRIASDDSLLYRAASMRELALCVAASEVLFHEGDLDKSIQEAKTALSICWKVSKKVAIPSTDTRRFDLPVQVKAVLGKLGDVSVRKSTGSCFEAIECWSWDVLLAAKLVLTRLATLYTLTNRLHRSSVYYAEAMALVSTVVPTETRDRPFFEFAQLQLLAERTSHASAVHQLISLSLDVDSTMASQVEPSVLAQHCEVLMQRGDLAMLEGDDVQALQLYDTVLGLLGCVERSTPGLKTVACGCYRRMTKIHARTLRGSESPTADKLIDTLKNLKRAIAKCSDLLETVLATCELVQASVLLLRLPRVPKAFLPAHKLKALVEDAFAKSDHLGIPFVSMEVRLTMGHVYLLLSEESVGVSNISSQDRSLFKWATADLLSSYNIVGLPPPMASTSGPVDTPFTRGAQLLKRVPETLPSDWLVVSLAVGIANDLMLSLIPANGCEPLAFWIGNVEWEACTQELSDIIAASRETLSGATAQGAEGFTSEQKKAWWKTRNNLNEQLGALVLRMQTLLGFWRALLAYTPEQEPPAHSKSFISACSRLFFSSDRRVSSQSTAILLAVASFQSSLSDSEILQCVDHIALVEERVSIDASTAQQLLQAIQAYESSTSASRSIILILHHRLEQFPWEGLNIFQPHSVTRMPSLELVLANANRFTKRDATVDASRVAYLLNPGGDLKSTERNLAPIFERGASSLGWRGTVCSIPEEDTVREYLVQSDLFVFAGHGSGEKYFHRDKIASLRGQQNCAATLLFGCSSGRLEREGIFGPDGAVLAYLQAGSPAVLAMLWDVTDRDVDLMSKELLEKWLLEGTSDGGTLSMALSNARRLCKLQYLNGHAAVCYGLPLRVSPRQDRSSAATKRRRLF